MTMIDPRPTKAQFAALSPTERATHMKPLAPAVRDEDGELLLKDGKPTQDTYPTMTGIELRNHRVALGLTEKDLAAKLGLRGKTPLHSAGHRVALWEKGNPQNLERLKKLTTVPGPIALKVLALREGK